MASLPWMGLGLSSNLSARGQPHPYQLLARAPGAFDYLEYSAPLELEHARREASLFEQMWSSRDRVPVVFHPVHLNLYGPELEQPRALAALADHLARSGSPWVGNDVGWWHSSGRMFPGYLYLPPPLTRAAVADVSRHALHVQAAIGVPLLLENPAIYAPRGPLHVLDFMAELHARTGLGLLIDAGHLLSHQLSRGLAADSGFDGFPFEAVLEVHVAGGVITEREGRRFYADDHPQPIREEVLALLAELLPRCPNLRALTYEGDGHPIPIAIDHLRRLRALLPEQPALQVGLRAPEAPPPGPLETDPWSIYERVFADRGESDDPQADRAEQDFRLAVLAERLDRSHPLSRALLAGSRAGLAAFSASPELREAFTGRGRTVPEAFVRFARRVSRESPDEAIAAVLAIESWINDLAASMAPGADRAGQLALAPEVRVVELPVDLSELQHSVRALDRHLSGRARAAGEYESSALTALQQVARRAPARPWPVAVVARGAAVELLGLSPALYEVLSLAAAGNLDPALRPELVPAVEEARARGLLGVAQA